MEEYCSSSGSSRSRSKISSSSCICYGTCYCEVPGEYIIDGGEAGEGSCRTSTVFSWQHFPPSTSSRSRCDDSSMQPEGASLPESCKVEIVEEKEVEASTSPLSSTEYPITKSKAQLDAEHYLNIRNIFHLFNFLIGHLICAEPEDPIQYLKEILDRCLLWRDCYGEEPLLVSKYHLKSLYGTFDPYGKGSISKDQYELAMDNIGLTKGISQYNACPPLNEEGKVDEEFFLNEAHRCFLENLRMMLRVPKDWEENRLLWNKKMLRKREQEQPICERKSDYPGEDETDMAPWESNVEVSKTILPTPCQQLQKMRHEPVQLFLPV